MGAGGLITSFGLGMLNIPFPSLGAEIPNAPMSGPVGCVMLSAGTCVRWSLTSSPAS